MRVICQICGEFIAECSIEGVSMTVEGGPVLVKHTIAPLRYPLSGAMFGSPDPTHAVPAPFDSSLDWEYMRCPYGRIHRPMVKDYLVKTHKGMVRLPKDGSPAFLDPTETGDVDRESVGDRMTTVSDRDAEKIAREILQGGAKVIVSDEVPKDTILVFDPSNCNMSTPGAIVIESAEPIPPLHVYEIKNDPSVSGYICAVCSKKFPTEKQLEGHIGGAHKVKVAPEKTSAKTKAVAKKKGKR
jgi:hypothetical protein